MERDPIRGAQASHLDQLETPAPAPKPDTTPAAPVEYSKVVKPGHKTSEFKVTTAVQIATAAVGVLAIFVPHLPADAIVDVVQWVGGILGGTAAAYATSRGLAKRGS